MSVRLRLIALPVALLAVCACSRLPDRIETVERARTSIGEIGREPLAGRAAARELAAAQDALAAADTAYEDREPLEIIEHHAYVAQRYADISREMVAEARAREEVERGEAERNRIIADAREREAAAAQRTAEQATREAEVQSLAAEEQARVARERGLAATAAEERNRELERELEDLQAEETDRGLVLTLGDVLFDTGQATLKAGAATTVDRLAQFMRDYPERSVRIEGHTDSAGSDDANQSLSERRAQAVREALMQRGLEAPRIGAVGYGEARPIADNETAAGRQQNRRVEIVVSDSKGAFAEDSKRSLL
jgi:outer membrane protein OmpA-like peptidoglycan-associated protein